MPLAQVLYGVAVDERPPEAVEASELGAVRKVAGLRGRRELAKTFRGVATGGAAGAEVAQEVVVTAGSSTSLYPKISSIKL